MMQSKKNYLNLIKWTLFSEVITKSISPLTFIILAIFLSPKDYGYASIAFLVIGFCRTFWESALTKTIVQSQEDLQLTLQVTFRLSLILGIFISLVLFLLANSIGNSLFHESVVGSIIRVLSIQVFMGAIATVPTGLLQREMHFKKLFFIQTATGIASALVSIPMAWLGWGYNALIFGALSGQFIQIFLLWGKCDWKPAFFTKTNGSKIVAKYMGWVAIDGFLGWLYVWMDSLIIGVILGSTILGLYRISGAMVIIMFGAFVNPFVPIF